MPPTAGPSGSSGSSRQPPTHGRFLAGIPAIDSPFFEATFAAGTLPEPAVEIARSLHRHGFAVIDFPEPELDALAADIVARLDPVYEWEEWRAGRRKSLRLIDGWKHAESVRRIAMNREILSLLETLYGRRPIPFQTLNFPLGTQQSMHTDSVHFDSLPGGFMCGVWVALEDTDESNGPLVYCPGSHRLPPLTNDRLGVAAPAADPQYAHYRLFEETWERLVDDLRLERREFHARKGQALIWAAYLLHGGARQLDPGRSRHSQVTHYFFEDCCYYTPLLSNPFMGRIAFRTIMNVGTGELIPNRLNSETVPAELIAACMPISE